MPLETPFTRILVPTDGSDNSNHAGRLATVMSGIHNAKLTIAYVVDDTIVDEIASATGKNRESTIRELEEKGKRYVDYIARIAERNDVRHEEMIRNGTPYREIADLAREIDARLIVIGRVGCRGPRCALVGSVAERVIEYAPCPVLVVNQDPGGLPPRR